MTKHTDQCLKNQAALAAFDAKHPDACKHCGATGFTHTHATMEDPPDDDFCQHCVANDRCPLCGNNLIVNEATGETECASPDCEVGWSEDHMNNWEARPDFDCECDDHLAELAFDQNQYLFAEWLERQAL